MIQPIKDFCALLAQLDDEAARESFWFCNLALGRPDLPTNSPPEEFTELLAALHDEGVKGLVTRWVLYTRKSLGIDEEFLTKSLLFWLTDFYRRLSDKDLADEAINFNLDRLEHFRSELSKPLDDRQDLSGNEELKSGIQHFRESLSRQPARREQAARALQVLQDGWRAVFTDTYWRQFRFQRVGP